MSSAALKKLIQCICHLDDKERCQIININSVYLNELHLSDGGEEVAQEASIGTTAGGTLSFYHRLV